MSTFPLPGVYLADTLAPRHPGLAAELTTALNQCGARVATLAGTRDIWARDYMPVPTTSGRWVLFRYAPDYLRPKCWQHTITDGAQLLQQLGLPFQASGLVVDGGNVVRYAGKVLMTDKVLRENPTIPRGDLLSQLATALEVDHVDLLPAHPQDFTGHADGLVHLLDERTALVNDCRQREPGYWHHLTTCLQRAGYACIPLPYNPYQNTNYISAVGTYLNFLRVGTGVVVPIYRQVEDEPVLCSLQKLYPHHQILPVEARSIAQQGGVFHCITWTCSPPELVPQARN
ncbi:hypothetical protein DNI29_23105 [Hymenobacter sediminis]|uniref:agmatine deiminase family protein n=1 Tax=Hymenobacter sediminis TaxID=2218621 RepID=UPI000F4F9743|nr:agmatine deiminase family protein [Hymenobacter sediminis]RPD43751.1 hypothetical protein DNI29_23105 [Hymenobacter sediminis]